MAKYKIISFYKFINLEDTQFLKTELLNFCNQHDIKGTIIVANEGINSTLSANQDSVDKFCKTSSASFRKRSETNSRPWLG